MSVLEQMETLGLDDMKAVRLMDRVDHKFMASDSQLEELLSRIAGKYFALATLVAPYRTLYFDTADLDMYTMHHNGKLGRQKLRVRTYRSTETTFFEIKTKSNKLRTCKVRIPMEASRFEQALEEEEVRRFIGERTPYTVDLLSPCLENSFKRITLVDKGMSERVTIDHGIHFRNRATKAEADIAHLLVIEVKHEKGAPTSFIERTLHEMHIPPRRMSKYCIGTALTNPLVKQNMFKNKLLYINKITAK